MNNPLWFDNLEDDDFIEDDDSNEFDFDDETCVNCDELRDGYEDEDGMGGHGWTCRLCGAFNCEWGC